MAGSDLLLTTSPRDAPPGTPALANAELGLVARLEARGLADRFDFKLDFQGREGFIGNSYRNQVVELFGAVRLLDDRLKITIGRVRTPGGFWLIVDGLRLDVRYRSWIGQSFWGGLRAFSTGRRDTWAVPRDRVVLPVVGTALWIDRKGIQAQLGVSWARDAIDFPLDGRGAQRGILLERTVKDEYFVDGLLQLQPHATVSATAGFSLGTRYEVRLDAGQLGGPLAIQSATLGAIGVHGALEYRPRKTIRLRYDLHYERLRILHVEVADPKQKAGLLDNGDGSFHDHAWLAAWRPWRAVRLEGRYRLRSRANGDLEHRLLVGARADQLWHGLGLAAAVGVDLNRLPGRLHRRVVYSAGLTFVRSFLELAAGLHFTDGIGSGLTFSSPTPGAGAAPRTLFPFVLESNRVVYARAFATFWKMYAGLEVEQNLEAVQTRLLVQIGGAL